MTRNLDAARAELAQAGLEIAEYADAKGFNDAPTRRYTIVREGGSTATQTLEVSGDFDCQLEQHTAPFREYAKEVALRLRNPHPDQAVTLGGLPIEYAEFAWPFHSSTSGADTYVVHGITRLADGSNSPLHAKVAAGMTLTFAEIVSAPEQPFAEMFVRNAIRKTLDLGQLELVKSGNRQPVNVTTRYYSRWSKKFNFNDTKPEQRVEFLARKLYWLGTVNGGGAAIWLTDPADAQYLNCTPEELAAAAKQLEQNGDARNAGDGMWTPAEKLAARSEEFRRTMDEALLAIKPTFNEDMRGGHTNM